jgi:hypothetical protein
MPNRTKVGPTKAPSYALKPDLVSRSNGSLENSNTFFYIFRKSPCNRSKEPHQITEDGTASRTVMSTTSSYKKKTRKAFSFPVIVNLISSALLLI